MNGSQLESAELHVLGRLVDASNATLLCEIFDEDGESSKVIYKPTAGERPLWDFPKGNLAGREVAAFKLSELLEFHLVPETVLRDGPFGPGSVQRWIEVDEEIDLTLFSTSSSEAIRKIAFFDVLVNNTDRKFGHLLPVNAESIFACDHGLTFHTEDKLRTVLWQFAGEALSQSEIATLNTLLDGTDSQMWKPFNELITHDEIAALLSRAKRLIDEGVFPMPSEDWPTVPWPPF